VKKETVSFFGARVRRLAFFREASRVLHGRRDDRAHECGCADFRFIRRSARFFLKARAAGGVSAGLFPHTIAAAFLF
jgi:hypothetical protein